MLRDREKAQRRESAERARPSPNAAPPSAIVRAALLSEHVTYIPLLEAST